MPSLRRLGIMANIASYIGVLEMRDALAVARTLGLGVAMLEIRKANDIAPAIEALKGGADALYVVTEPLVNTNRVQINALALAAGLPTLHGQRPYVEAGGLCHMEQTSQTYSGARPTWLTRFCVGPSRAISPSSSRQSSIS